MDRRAFMSVREFKKDVAKKVPLESLVFFGSRARGKYGKDSDIDLIIVSKKFRGKSFFKRVKMMYDYWKHDYPVDFLCYTPEEFNRLKGEASIVSQALDEGVAV